MGCLAVDELRLQQGCHNYPTSLENLKGNQDIDETIRELKKINKLGIFTSVL